MKVGHSVTALSSLSLFASMSWSVWLWCWYSVPMCVRVREQGGTPWWGGTRTGQDKEAEEEQEEGEKQRLKVHKNRNHYWNYIKIFAGDEPVSGMSSDYDARPCIGMCYYRKLYGISLDKVWMAKRMNRKPCIGLCHRERQRNAKALEEETEGDDI